MDKGKDKLKIAAVQFCANEDKKENLTRISRYIHTAIEKGVDTVVLPEVFNCCGRTEVMVKNAEQIPGYTTSFLSDIAQRGGISIVCGTIYEKAEKNKVFNTSVLVGRDGEILAKYRKIHLFDVDISGRVRYKESDYVTAGNEIVTVSMDNFDVGLVICYDLRFCELFRILALRGAKIIFLPSAFTLATGKYHWEPLIKARAIENQVFIVAVNQIGTSPNNITCYGKSMIVDPWGRVLAEAEDDDNIISAEIDLNVLDTVRADIPSFSHRRIDLY
ncbi:MAG: carbon-nitrogen hydrolase family protein [Candidatus Scalindua sp. AMX11]|nr:MAG: carbon-nitrogen hydrolase family protein [Candidatus Scalindua sp.]NOG85539.1 carbon-nitrogen hydrolase family protein [Planctomycetota bacterium]RZV90213.1 MAG: carbon-nitrogen hydrolase family protein [Candidatus Scalindua sp. SCAELEC01]TDE64998.1 MAG: carbon-nitrogen hydrolase family protein [Candidatus Scalindua sp. AMX11]GJQ59567.1 MAG: carbon-nitrogen hydrolase [Candidatus Scalindua sp.]